MSNNDDDSIDELDLTDLKFVDKSVKIVDKHKTVEKPNTEDKLINKVLDHQLEKKSKNIKPTEEELINKRRMILIIQMYINEFGDKLKKSFGKTNLEKKSYEELMDIKKEMDFTISNSSTIKASQQLVYTGLQSLEYVCHNFTPIKCEGMSAAIINDENSQNDIKHLCLKHCMLVSSEPEARLLFKVLSTMLMMHQVNSYKEEIKQVNDQTINKINERYQDI